MGGEINIRDKEHGERGICFRFNVFLKSAETTSGHVLEEDKDSCSQNISNQSHSFCRRESSAIGSSIRAMAFRKPPKVEGIQSLLLIEGDETKRILQTWMENMEMKVWIVDKWELLYSMLEKCKYANGGSGKFDATLHGYSLKKIKSLNSGAEKDILRSSKDETDQILPLSTKEVSKKRFRDSLVCILVIIDINYGYFSNICTILNNFLNDNQRMQFKVVWLVNANTQSAELRGLKQNLCDLILKKPIHGSRLHAILKLIQDFGGKSEGHSCTVKFTEPDSLKERSQVQNTEKPFAGMKILLVEDTFLMRRIGSATLSRLGATVEFAENGLEALNLIKKVLQEKRDYDENKKAQGSLLHFPYDVVLMDCEVIKCLIIFIYLDFLNI